MGNCKTEMGYKCHFSCTSNYDMEIVVLNS